MQGKILGDGVISGSDGNRYTYKPSELKNAKDTGYLVGSEVDFEIKDGKASEVYITKKAFNIDGKLLGDDLPSIKLKAYIAIACSLLTFIPFLGVIFAIAAIILNIILVVSISKSSNSTTLLKNFILSIVAVAVGLTIVLFSVGGSMFSLFLSGAKNTDFLSNMGFVGITFGIIIALSWLYFSYQFYKELSFVTNEPFFLYAFYARLVGGLTIVVFVGFLFLLLDFVLEVIAWLRTKEIRQSKSAPPNPNP